MVKPGAIEIFEETALSFMKKYYQNVFWIVDLIEQAKIYSSDMINLIGEFKVDYSNCLEYDLIEKMKNILLEKMR